MAGITSPSLPPSQYNSEALGLGLQIHNVAERCIHIQSLIAEGKQVWI